MALSESFLEHRFGVMVGFWVLISGIETSEEVVVTRQIANDVIEDCFSRLEPWPSTHCARTSGKLIHGGIGKGCIEAPCSTAQRTACEFGSRVNYRQILQGLPCGDGGRERLVRFRGRLPEFIRAMRAAMRQQLQRHRARSLISGWKRDPVCRRGKGDRLG